MKNLNCFFRNCFDLSTASVYEFGKPDVPSENAREGGPKEQKDLLAYELPPPYGGGFFKIQASLAQRLRLPASQCISE